MAHSTFTLAVSTLLCAGHSASAADESASKCSLTGAEHLNAQVEADELCRNFERDLMVALAKTEHRANTEGLVIVLQAQKRGRIKAAVTAQEASKLVEYPEVAIDVMDRPLRPEDLRGLAYSTAQIIARN